MLVKLSADSNFIAVKYSIAEMLPRVVTITGAADITVVLITVRVGWETSVAYEYWKSERDTATIPTAEVTEITCPANVTSSLNGLYWTYELIVAGSPVSHYTWYQTVSVGADPAPGGTGHLVNLTNATLTAAQVASETAAVISEGVYTSGDSFTLTNAETGDVVPVADGNAGISPSITALGTDVYSIQGQLGDITVTTLDAIEAYTVPTPSRDQ